MLTLSSRSYWAPGGWRIHRPIDRSCWILCHPTSHYRPQYGTRREAMEAARRLSARATMN